MLWALQVILAVKFLSEAYMHAFRTDRPEWQRGIEKMGKRARPILSFVALCSFLGGLGLVLPAASGILPWLTPLAAALLALLMVRGIVFHIACRAKPNVLAGVVLVALAAFVAYGRWVLAPL